MLAAGGAQGVGVGAQGAAGEMTQGLATLSAMHVAEVVAAVEVQPLLLSTQRRAASWFLSVAVEEEEEAEGAEENSTPLRVERSSLQVALFEAGLR